MNDSELHSVGGYRMPKPEVSSLKWDTFSWKASTDHASFNQAPALVNSRIIHAEENRVHEPKVSDQRYGMENIMLRSCSYHEDGFSSSFPLLRGITDQISQGVAIGINQMSDCLCGCPSL